MNGLLEEFAKIAGQDAVDQLTQLVHPLKGMKIVHVNSTQIGGGVAEILSQMIPLMHALGLDVKWEIVVGDEGFFHCTKQFHNALQGVNIGITAQDFFHYESINKGNAERLRESLNEADVVFIHDPQPVSLIESFPDRKGKWIWRCHIDASKPVRSVWKYLKNYIRQYDAAIFSLAEFTHPLPIPMFLILPSIDPLSEKNCELNPSDLMEVRKQFGIDPDRPMILQVSRYDRFKDPLGVVEAFQIVKKFNPTVQLVLAGGEASDDPEGSIVLKEVLHAASGNPDIHILLLAGDAHRTVNALQRSADIIIQKSIKEGFGLTVTEALWKGKAVIGGNVGGIRSQVINWQTGFLVNTPEGAAWRIRYFLHNKQMLQEMGMKGRELVREKFLITRHLREYLTLIYSLHNAQDDRMVLKGDFA